MSQSRDSVRDIWGERMPYGGGGRWPIRVDEHLTGQPDRRVQSCCILCSTGCGPDVGVKEGNTLLFQSAQSLRDRAILDATLSAEEQLRRMLAWLLNQVKHHAVHSLIVPM